MRLAIIGSGALACLFGARLAPHAAVILVGTWPEGIAAISRDGIRLESNAGAVTIPVRASTDPAAAAPADFALVLVKSWQTARAAQQAVALLAPQGLAVTLQNGLGNLEALQAVLGQERALPGVTTLGATLLGPGRVRAGGEGPVYLPADPRLDRLADHLIAAGLETLRPPTSDLRSLLWGKIVVNCGINPLTALLCVPNGELLLRPAARRLLEQAACEAAAVAQAHGIALPFPDPAAQARAVARATAGNRSSMLQDVLRGAPTEIDAINGAVVRAARAAGVPAPVNEVLCALLRAMGERALTAEPSAGTM